MSDVSRRFWTEKEDKFIRKNYSTIQNKHIAKDLNRTVCSIRHRGRTLSVKKKVFRTNDISYIEVKRLYLKGYTQIQIRDMVGYDIRGIHRVLKELGLLRTTTETKRIKGIKKVRVTKKLIDYVDGIIIGDGSIIKSSAISANLSLLQREDRLEWLKRIQIYLTKFGIKSRINKRRQGWRKFPNGNYSFCQD
ncbi:MAG: LAGLIDADG family homing endonuclease, partial [Calditrichia bacterium]